MLSSNTHGVTELQIVSRCTETGEVYTWGWKECVPSEKIACGLVTGGSFQNDSTGKQNSLLNDQGFHFFH